MEDIAKMTRVICHHHWTGLDEWVDSIHRLAYLNEDELCRLSDNFGDDRSPAEARRHTV